jgi:DNA-binding IclR family transcriptional regulator
MIELGQPMTKSDPVLKPRVPTIHKIGELLAVFTPARSQWKLQDLARQLEWDVATTHRFLKALVDIRLLDYHDETYSIGLLPLELASVSVTTAPRRRQLLERIQQISEESGLTVQIGVLERDAVAIVASHESRGALRAAAMLGERLPLHATAVGKAILTQLSDAEIEELLPSKLPAFTDRTITERTRLLDELRAGRESGMTHADGELSEGLYALAIPIPWGYFASQVAGLTCAGVSREIVPEQWETAAGALRQQLEEFGAPTPVVGDGAVAGV